MRLPILLASLLLLLAPAAAHLPPPVRLAGIVGCIFLFTLTFNIAMDPYQALLADKTTPEQRGRVTGVWFFVGAFGQVAFLLLPLALPLPEDVRFGVLAALMLGTTLLTCAKTPEPRVALPPETQRGHWDDLKLALIGLSLLKQARIYMAMFFLYGMGIGGVVPFLTLFIWKITGCPKGTAEMMPALLLVMTALGSLAFGPLADRIGFKRVLLGSFGLIAAAAFAAADPHWVTTLPEVAAVLGLAGLGIGAQNASAYPLLTRLVPAKEIGFYVGLQTAAASLAGPGAVALTGHLINLNSRPGHTGYRIIFTVCAVCLAAALVTLAFLREENAASEIAAREREIAGPISD